MAVTHTNRKGVVYYLHEGKTSKGKPCYHFSKDGTGALVEAVPDGYEIYEKPRGQVYLRRIVPRNVRPEHAAVIEAGIRRYSEQSVFLLELTTNEIEVHIPDQTREDFEHLAKLLGSSRLDSLKLDWFQRNGSFSPALRFSLVNRKTGLFTVERWYCRGGGEGWSYSLGHGRLEELVKKYAPHLGKQSFFDLM